MKKERYFRGENCIKSIEEIKEYYEIFRKDFPDTLEEYIQEYVIKREKFQEISPDTVVIIDHNSGREITVNELKQDYDNEIKTGILSENIYFFDEYIDYRKNC